MSEAPPTNASLADVLQGRAREHPERTASIFLQDGETEADRRTYAELDARARAIAALLLARGAAPGDRALLLYPPGLDFIDAFFGCLYAGVIAVPCYPPRPGREQPRLKAILADAGARFALCTATIAGRLETLAADDAEMAGLARIATDGPSPPDPLSRAATAPPPRTGEGEAVPDTRIAFLQYTSGSTSTPKGVMVTQANLVFMERLIADVFAQDEASVVVGWLPVYHDMGLIGNVLQPLWLGATCVLMAPVAFLRRPRRWLEAISRYRATTSGGPSFAYELCAAKIAAEDRAGLDLSSWRVAFNGAEPVRAAALASFATAFAASGFRPEAFQPCYGLAEATLLVSGIRRPGGPVLLDVDAAALEAGKIELGDEGRRRTLVGCGQVPAEQPVAVVDPMTREACAPGRVGELWVRGPGVAAGYWRRPEETREIFLADGWLRTGDLGFLHDGELFVTGRLKDLVILRGRNHYPQDLELTAERSTPGLALGANAAFSVEVDGEERLVLAQELAPRARLDAAGLAAAVASIRRAVAEEHEAQVWEVLLLKAGTVPKTSSGKIQRRATRALYLDGALEPLASSRLAAETARPVGVLDREALLDLPAEDRACVLDSWLRTRAAEALRVAVEDLDAGRPLIDLGLDSLAAIELGNAVETVLGIELPPGDLLEGAGTGELAKFILERIAGAEKRPHPRPLSHLPPQPPPGEGSPLSYGQRGLWLLHRLNPQGTAYHLTGAMRLRDDVAPQALRAAFQALVDRHPALRTTFHDDGGEPFQRIRPTAEVAFEEINGRDLEEIAWRPFDLAAGPLFRVTLLDRGPEDRVLLVAAHHIVADFWSFGVMAREIAGVVPLHGDEVDFAWWQAERLATDGERLWDAWRERLADLPPLDLPADRPLPAQPDERGALRGIEIGSGVLDDAKALARGRGTTLFAVLLAAFETLLHRLSGQTAFAVGSPVAGRPAGLPGVAEAVGYFVSPVALRADLSGEPSFSEAVDQARRTVLDALALQDLPLPLLVEKLRAEGRDGDLFRVLFVLHRAPAGLEEMVSLALGEAGSRLRLGALEMEPLPLAPRAAAFDLTLAAGERRSALGVSLVYRAALLDATTAARWLEHFRTLLTAAAAHPDRSVADLSLLSAAERHQLLLESNDAEKTAEADWSLLQEGFERQAARTPEAVALIDGTRRMTYRELNAEADRLADRLRAFGAGPEAIVGVHLPRTTEMVTALLAVLKTGAAYLPLDPTYPEDRIALLLEDAKATLIVEVGCAVRTIDGSRAHSAPYASIAASQTAYLIYTSGSTGRPKGVAIPHANAVRLVAWAGEAYSRDELAGVLAATSINFDLSIFEIFVPLSFGGAVILAENALALSALPAAGKVTLLNTVPSAIAALLDLGPLPPSVRTVNLAGEPLRRLLAERVLTTGVKLWDLYGPSEDTTYSTGVPVHAGDPGEPSIGRPLAGSRAYVLDRSLHPAPLGIPGELCLGGGGVARGYLGRSALTAESFVPDPFSREPGARLYRTGDRARRAADGSLEYLGRFDHQVKIRGFRIEPGEIEAALLEIPDVREAAVVPRDGVLVAYVVEGTPPLGEGRTAEMRSRLQERLPAAFVPAFFVTLDALPRTPNGKLDRKALPAPDLTEESGAVAPSGPVEEALAALFAETLGADKIGATDDFFTLGGHSLLAARLLARVSRLFGVDLPLATIFRAPTVRALATSLSAAEPVSPLPGMGRGEPGEGPGVRASFAQQRLWLLDRLRPGDATYNMPGALAVDGPLHIPALAAAFGRVVRRHESLRTRFASREGEPVQIVDPPPAVPFPLPLVDLSSLPEPVRDETAGILARAVAARPFDLVTGPLIRVTLLRLAPERHVELLTVHHIVADGWSLGVMAREVAAGYAAAAPHPLPPLPHTHTPSRERGKTPPSNDGLPLSRGLGGRVGEGAGGEGLQYTDFAVWQRRHLAGGVLDRLLAWWTERLAGAPLVLELPVDHPRPAVRTARGSRVESFLPETLAGGLRELARRRGTTLFLTLLAGFQALLLRHTGQEDFLVGTATANRRPETEGMIGLFADTLALRAELAGDPAFTVALELARETALGAFAHQDLPFERLVAALRPERTAGEVPLLQAALAFQAEPPEPALPGLAVRRLPVDSGTAKFDLNLDVEESPGGLRASWELSRDLFEPATIERLAARFTNLLAGAVADPTTRLSALPLLDEAERLQLLDAGDGERGFVTPDGPLHRLVEEQARRVPDRIALVAAEGQVSYGELDARAQRLARHLLELGVTPEARVGVAVERSLRMIESFLAILKAGAAYVPLDPALPQERLDEMIEEAGIGWILTDSGLGEGPKVRASSAQGNALGWVGGQNLAYVLFTSGSTGRPKAVAVEHRSIIRLIRPDPGTGFADLGPDQVFFQIAPPSFDASTPEIWGALANGGRLVLPPPGPLSLDELGALLARHEVTILLLTSGLFQEVVESRIGILRGVRQLLAGGDVVSPAAVNRMLAELPGCRLVCCYGPTENTIFTSTHVAREPIPGGTTVPLGRPIGGTRVAVLDRFLQPVPAGVAGELWTGGTGLARGYLGRPDLTAERFAPDPDATTPGERLYRTGDLVRWRQDLTLEDLTLEFLGRVDRQVKIRGFRVELGEVEVVLARHPAVAGVVVVVHGRGAGDKRLLAFVVSAVSGAALSAWLGERLPGYLVPTVEVVAGLPLTANGKVDRAALLKAWEEKDQKDIRDIKDGKDMSPVEAVIASIWADVLGVERVGLEDDFFALGGHSLLATRVLSRIVDTLGVEVPLAALFEAPTVAGLAEALTPAPLPAPPALPPGEGRPAEQTKLGAFAFLPSPGDRVGGAGRGAGVRAPLSFAQQRLWFLDRLEPGSAAYNLPVALRLRGRLDFSHLSAALAGIVRRHEALRTTFPETPDGPLQEIAPVSEALAAFAVPVEDLSALGSAAESVALRRMEEEGRRPFNLQTGPVFRPRLLRIAAEDHLLVVNLHHIAGDGWSMGVLVRELATYYSFPPLPEGGGAMGEGGQGGEVPPVQYADYAAWQRAWLTGDILAAEVAWWREALRGLPERLDLPTDHPRRPVEKRRGALRPVEIDAEVTHGVARLARREGVTPFIVLLAAFQALLGRVTGQDDLAVGSPVAGRDRVELEELVGFFVNTLVLRGDLSGEPSFNALLRRTRSVVLAAHRHQHLPFEKLVEELAPVRELGTTPLFAAMLAFQGPVPRPPVLPGLTAEIVPVPTGTAKLDLLLDLGERDGSLAGFLEYDADLFDPPSIDRLLGHLRSLLTAAVADPGLRLADLPLLGAPERQQLLEWNATAVSYPAATIPALFAAQAAATPERIAVTFGGAALTYRELDAAANRLARPLRRLGVGPDVVVGVALHRSLEMVVALYAVLKAGGAYLPLDLADPDERLALLIADAGAPVVLTLEEHRGRFSGGGALSRSGRGAVARAGEGRGGGGRGDAGAASTPGAEVIVLDGEHAAIEAESSDPLPLEITAANLAYLIFTSGSTGAPKGVMNTHAGIANRLLWMQAAYPLGAADRVLQKTPFTFDVSVWEFFWPLLTGACLVVALPDGHRDPAYLRRTLVEEGITTLHFVPSMLQVFLEEPGVGAAVSVRQVMASGEALPAALAERFFAGLPGARLHNLYGPTEAAVDVSAWTCAPGESPVPIGRPIANIDLRILDRSFRPVPVGSAGELCIGGVGLARGYRNRPALTAERFVPHPESGRPGERLYRTGDLARWRPDGRIEYLGRLDHQVKIRGQRIEPGEIEAALAQDPAVRECAVLAREDRQGGLRLVAYVVPRGGGLSNDEIDELRAALRRCLPEPLIPAAFVTLAALPLTANGKLDRRALPAPDAVAGGRIVAPRTAAEAVLAGIWRDVLDLPAVGVDDNFFDLGGHSLLATRVVSRLRTTFGVEVPVRALFESPTIAKLAQHPLLALLVLPSPLSRRGDGRETGEGPGVRALLRVEYDRPAPLSFAQQRLWFLAQLDPESAAYNLPAAVDLDGALDVPRLSAVLREIVRRHETLRTTFQMAGSEPVQVVGSVEDFRLPLIDLTALGGLPERAAAEAERLTAEDAVRPFDLLRGPVFRPLLLRIAPDRHRLLASMHHIVSDGWSLGVFIHELGALFAGSPLPGLEIQYSDFARWQRGWLTGETLERELAFWRGELAGLPPGLDLPTDRPRPPVQTFRGASRPVTLGPALSAGLRDLARAEGATPFMVLMAGFQMLLARLSGQDDLAVGTPVAGRTHTELEGLIGFFVNTLVLRAEMADDPDLRTHLGRTRERSLAGQAHQDVSFERLVEELKPERNLARPPLFQVLFVFQNTPRAPLALPGLTVRPLAVATGTAKFELHLSLEETEEGIAGTLDFNRDLFEATTIDRLVRWYATLLAAGAADPGLRLSDLPLLSAPERHQLLSEWNDGQEAPRDRTLVELFAEKVKERPGAVAVSCGADRLIYGDLDRLSDALARRLRALGAAPEERVGICLDRSTAMIIALLGVLKTGAAYVPLDPEHPAERQALVLGDAQPRALVATPEIAARLAIPEGLPVVSPADSSEGGGLPSPARGGGLAARAGEGPGEGAGGRTVADPAHPAYIIYTSGSTGLPKGVAVTHAEAVRLLTATDPWFRFGPADTWTQFFSFAFDFSVWEIWGALAYGGRLVIVPHWVSRSPADVYDLLAAEQITVLNQTPSAFRQLIQAEGDRPAEQRRRLALRTVIFGGEALDVASLAPWFERHGDHTPRMINMYGITETTVHVTYRPVTAADISDIVRAPVSPLGVPIPDLQVHLLDRHLHPVPVGVHGEICVGGNGLARGYFRRPDLTAQRFIPDPYSGRPGARLYRSGDLARRLPDGGMDYLGRIDFQVKIRGFRIELGEIEAVLLQHPSVRLAAVLAREEPDRLDNPGDRRLVAYVVPRDRSLSVEDLRAALRQRLPEYMVPAAFVVLDALPLTANGKLDRRALPAPDAAPRGPAVAPRTATEEAIAAVWREVLGLPAVGVKDSFFDLGGHSLLVVQVHRRLSAQFPELAIVDLFRYPTISALARLLTRERVDQVDLEESRERADTRIDRARKQRELRRKR
jgi:amino acid adenylation domain-containing protein